MTVLASHRCAAVDGTRKAVHERFFSYEFQSDDVFCFEKVSLQASKFVGYGNSAPISVFLQVVPFVFYMERCQVLPLNLLYAITIATRNLRES